MVLLVTIKQFKTRVLRCGRTASFTQEIRSHLPPQKFSLWGISWSWLLQLKTDQSETVHEPRGKGSPAPRDEKWTLLTLVTYCKCQALSLALTQRMGAACYLQNMGFLLKGDPSVFSSGFYCTKGAEQHSNCDRTLPSPSPTLLYALGAISVGKRQALDSKQFVVLKFWRFWPMFAKRETPSTGRTMDRAAPFWHKLTLPSGTGVTLPTKVFFLFEPPADQRIALQLLEKSCTTPGIRAICLPTATLSAEGGFQSNALQCKVFRRVHATDRNIYIQQTRTKFTPETDNKLAQAVVKPELKGLGFLFKYLS